MNFLKYDQFFPLTNLDDRNKSRSSFEAKGSKRFKNDSFTKERTLGFLQKIINDLVLVRIVRVILRKTSEKFRGLAHSWRGLMWRSLATYREI